MSINNQFPSVNQAKSLSAEEEVEISGYARTAANNPRDRNIFNEIRRFYDGLEDREDSQMAKAEATGEVLRIFAETKGTTFTARNSGATLWDNFMRAVPEQGQKILAHMINTLNGGRNLEHHIEEGMERVVKWQVEKEAPLNLDIFFEEIETAHRNAGKGAINRILDKMNGRINAGNVQNGDEEMRGYLACVRQNFDTIGGQKNNGKKIDTTMAALRGDTQETAEIHHIPTSG